MLYWLIGEYLLSYTPRLVIVTGGVDTIRCGFAFHVVSLQGNILVGRYAHISTTMVSHVRNRAAGH